MVIRPAGNKQTHITPPMNGFHEFASLMYSVVQLCKFSSKEKFEISVLQSYFKLRVAGKFFAA